MPKYKFDEFSSPKMNRESEEYEPSFEELEEESNIERQIGESLGEIEYEIRNKGLDEWYSYPGEDSGSDKHVSDPDDLMSQLFYVREDYLSKIKDKELRKRMEDKIARVEQMVYKHYIPFIEKNIEGFAVTNSPEERWFDEKRAAEILQRIENELFPGAEAAAKQSIKDEKELLMFRLEINGLKQELIKYQKEPRLYSFYKLLDDLQKKRIILVNDENYYENSDNRMIIDNYSIDENNDKFKKLLKLCDRLQEIAGRMKDEYYKEGCSETAENSRKMLNNDLNIQSQPERILHLEGLIKDLMHRAESKDVTEDDFIKIKQQIMDFQREYIRDRRFQQRLENAKILFKLAWRNFNGENVMYEEIDDREKITNRIGWAKKVLGVAFDADREEIREAYRNMALRYHPDRNNAKTLADKADLETKLKRINDAYSILNKGNYRKK